jgi:large subunit ribosomal protein L24
VKLKKGDLVQVLAGKDRGKQGRVLEARPGDGTLIVENINLAKRHTKPRPVRDTNRMGGVNVIPGGIVEKAVPLAVSNVMLVCPTCKEATRVGVTLKEIKGERRRVRVCKRPSCRQEID